MPAVVLFQPQIPPNTGNIGRTCAATATALHLIEPLGFALDDRTLRRAGLDYWPLIDLHRPCHWQAFESHRRGAGRVIALSSHGSCAYTSYRFAVDDWLLFGRETDGLPEEVLVQADAVLTIPMSQKATAGQPGVRSLNLSVSVGIVLFEALRQLGDPGQPG